MKEIYTDKELETIFPKLDFASLHKFKAFLANYNNLEAINTDELDEDKLVLNLERFFLGKLSTIKERLKLDINFSNKTIEEKILMVIEITKEMNIDYLLTQFKGKIDRETAEKLVLYGYTHGSCNSLGYTLCSLFEECELKIFSVGGGYGHQCVIVDGKCYDITGCSTIQEMKEFVAKEANKTVEQCTIKDIEPLKIKHKAMDRGITKYLGDIITLKADNIYGC